MSDRSLTEPIRTEKSITEGREFEGLRRKGVHGNTEKTQSHCYYYFFS